MRIAAIAALFLLTACPVALAEVYQWTDERGARHFTDDPSKIPSAGKREEFREKRELIPADALKEFKGALDLEGTWKGWGIVELKRGEDPEVYTGTYTDTLKTDVGRLELSLHPSASGDYSGKWREGETRLGELKFKIYNEGRAIAGTWCAHTASKVLPGRPPCDRPDPFKWERFDSIVSPVD
ncbi:MAG: DUF4124 domain-containing protein [Nitrospinae bacterium]|nr:DUF4124 domain-containing protein [Nitrospinota bacterium]